MKKLLLLVLALVLCLSLVACGNNETINNKNDEIENPPVQDNIENEENDLIIEDDVIGEEFSSSEIEEETLEISSGDDLWSSSDVLLEAVSGEYEEIVEVPSGDLVSGEANV